MQPVGLVPKGIQDVIQFGMQTVNILGNDVCQGPTLGLIPNMLHRIEVRRVRRKPFNLEPRGALLKQSSGGRTMSRQPIPHQNDCTAQMLMDFVNEPNEVFGPRVVIQEFVVQSQPQRPRRACDGGNRRNAFTSIPRALDRRVACRRPNSPPQWLQQKPTFIEKNQASLTFEALFLVAAKIHGANGRCPPHFVRGLAAQAAVGSNPADATTLAHIPDETPRRTVAGSCPAPGVRSIRRVHTPNTVCRALVQRPIPYVDGRKAWGLCPGEAWTEACLHASTPLSIGVPMKRWSQLPQPLPSTTCPSRRAWPRSFDGLRAARGFLMVSCCNCTKPNSLSIN
jgi:hypothetical protein